MTQPFRPTSRSRLTTPPLAVTWLPAGPSMEFASSLARRGWQVRQLREAPAAATDLLAVGASECLVLSMTGPSDDRALLLADGYRRAGGRAHLVLLLAEASAAQWRWAAQLTPSCHPWPLDAETLADLVERARELGSMPGPAAAGERRVTIRLGESVEVDGRVVDLGVAERNFLFELARRAGERISKDAAITGERGRSCAARECRRRLGRKLGAELAELLIPPLRGEPYRFREPTEVAAVSASARTSHPRTQLRILGRGSLRAASSDRLEMFA